MTTYLNIKCHMCKKVIELGVDDKDLARWRAGEMVQTAFPYLSASSRELLISKTCSDCFDKLFPPQTNNQTESLTE